MIKLGDIVSMKSSLGNENVSGYLVIDDIDRDRCAVEEITSRLLKASFVCQKSILVVLF